MEQMNGYFQLVRKEDGTYLKLYSPIGAGNMIANDDVADYLSKVGVVGYDTYAVREAIMTLSETRLVKLLDTVIAPVSEMAQVTVTEDRM
ncbi:MAG TPA: hypothetical protein VHP81_08080, partial [Lachnospiraceae bacterium]|nr:hypothetical protein [Lachnospiraceae bacterium]